MRNIEKYIGVVPTFASYLKESKFIKRTAFASSVVLVATIMSFGIDQGPPSVDAQGKGPTYTPTPTFTQVPDTAATIRAILTAAPAPIPSSTPTPDTVATIRAVVATAVSSNTPAPDTAATIRALLTAAPGQPTLPAGTPTPDIPATVVAIINRTPTPGPPTPNVLATQISQTKDTVTGLAEIQRAIDTLRPTPVPPQQVPGSGINITITLPPPIVAPTAPPVPTTGLSIDAFAATAEAQRIDTLAKRQAEIKATATEEARGTATVEGRQTATAEAKTATAEARAATTPTPAPGSQERYPWETLILGGFIGIGVIALAALAIRGRERIARIIYPPPPP